MRTLPKLPRFAATSAWSARRISSCASIGSAAPAAAMPALNSRRRLPAW
jgi:hypothetical protein